MRGRRRGRFEINGHDRKISPERNQAILMSCEVFTQTFMNGDGYVYEATCSQFDTIHDTERAPMYDVDVFFGPDGAASVLFKRKKGENV